MEVVTIEGKKETSIKTIKKYYYNIINDYFIYNNGYFLRDTPLRPMPVSPLSKKVTGKTRTSTNINIDDLQTRAMTGDQDAYDDLSYLILKGERENVKLDDRLLQVVRESLKYNDDSGITTTELSHDLEKHGFSYDDTIKIRNKLKKEGYITYYDSKGVIKPTNKLMRV